MTARPGASAVIRAIFALQLGLGALLLVGDAARGWTGFEFGPAAPRLDQPVRPGDQTRVYRPRDMPAPGTGLPATGPMPDRLGFEATSVETAPALRLTGLIARGDADRLADQLAASSEAPEIVVLNSPGGSVTDALEIGRMVRRRGIATLVLDDGICLSACPYVFAGGTVRTAEIGAKLGVHQHYFGENAVLPAFMAVEDIQRGQGLVLGYLDEMGIDLRLMGPALLTPPDEIYVLLPEELREFGLVTDEAAASDGA